MEILSKEGSSSVGNLLSYDSKAVDVSLLSPMDTLLLVVNNLLIFTINY